MRYKILEEFEEIVRMHEVKGTYSPDEIIEIENEYHKVKKKIEDHISALRKKAKSR